MAKHLIITGLTNIALIFFAIPCGAISTVDKIAVIDQEIKTLEVPYFYFFRTIYIYIN